jgi:hypothetical protein
MIKSRRMRWTGHIELMGEKRNIYRILVRKQEGKILLEKRRRKWVDLRETGWGGVDWIYLAQDMDQ